MTTANMFEQLLYDPNGTELLADALREARQLTGEKWLRVDCDGFLFELIRPLLQSGTVRIAKSIHGDCCDSIHWYLSLTDRGSH